MKAEYSIILTTVSLETEAEDLAEKLLETKLAACIQIWKIKSLYRWDEKIERSNEYLLSIKTKSDLFVKVSELIKQNHTYETPEIVQIPITNGLNEYLSWINNSVKSQT